MKKQQDLSALQFLFIEDSFLVDDVKLTKSASVTKHWKAFKEDKYHALYEIGFQELRRLS